MCVLSAREAAKKYKGWRICDRMRERERGSKNMKEEKISMHFSHLFLFDLKQGMAIIFHVDE